MKDNNMPEATKRSKVSSRIKNRLPEMDTEDDEALFGQIDTDYDDYENRLTEKDKELEEYKNREKSFADLFNNDPKSAAYLSDWKQGGDPVMALIRKYGMEIKNVLDDPNKQEEISKANEEYVKRVAMEKDLDDTYQKNINESLMMIDNLEKSGKSTQQVDEAFALLLGIVRDGIVGKFSPESFDMAFKALNHDADVQVAASDGEIKGRNAKIDETLRKKSAGDGTHPMGGTSSAPTQPARRNLGPLENYGSGTQDIWERGGMKRK